jgi:hypothetical protein
MRQPAASQAEAKRTNGAGQPRRSLDSATASGNLLSMASGI